MAGGEPPGGDPRGRVRTWDEGWSRLDHAPDPHEPDSPVLGPRQGRGEDSLGRAGGLQPVPSPVGEVHHEPAVARGSVREHAQGSPRNLAWDGEGWT